MSHEDDYDRFEEWLAHMDDFLESFLDSLPDAVRAKLNFSAASLDTLEAWLLERYAHIADSRPQSEAQVMNGAACYVGETLRLRSGGTWTIDYEDPGRAFYGVPQLVGVSGQETQICPRALTSASLDRRTGVFLSTIVNRHDALG